MPNLNITTDLDRDPWRDIPTLPNGQADPAWFGEVVRVGRLTAGMESGKSAVMVAIKLPDGRLVTGQTSMELFKMAAAAMRGAEERDGNAW